MPEQKVCPPPLSAAPEFQESHTIADFGSSRFTKVVLAISALFAAISGVTIVGLMLGTTFDVSLRRLGMHGVAGVVEWTEVILVIVVFAGLAFAELKGAHIRGASGLTDNPRSSLFMGARCLGSLTASALLLWGAFATSLAAAESVHIGEFMMGLVAVPIWPAKVAIPIGLCGFALVMLMRSYHQFKAMRKAKMHKIISAVSNGI